MGVSTQVTCLALLLLLLYLTSSTCHALTDINSLHSHSHGPWAPSKLSSHMASARGVLAKTLDGRNPEMSRVLVTQGRSKDLISLSCLYKDNTSSIHLFILQGDSASARSYEAQVTQQTKDRVKIQCFHFLIMTSLSLPFLKRWSFLSLQAPGR